MSPYIPPAPTAGLDTLPAELLQLVIFSLFLEDTCRLRLTSKALNQALYETISRCVKHKEINCSSPGQLKEFAYLTKPGRIGLRVENLTLSSSVSIDDRRRSIFVFGNPKAAFENLHLNSIQAALQSISLDTQCHDKLGFITQDEDGYSRRVVWRANGDIFRIVALALAETSLKVPELNIFYGLRSCSLGIDHVGPVLRKLQGFALFENVTSLSMGLSHHVSNYSNGPDYKTSETGHRRAGDVARFLSLLPRLETLQIHWFNTRTLRELNDAQRQEQTFLTHVVRLKILSNLKKFRLAGVNTNSTTLLSLFKTMTNLRQLSMEEIWIKGQFGDSFDFLTQNLTVLENLHLEELYEDRHTVCFEAPGRYRFDASDHNGPGQVWGSVRNGPGHLVRERSACREPIRYCRMVGRILSTSEVWRWRRQRQTLYGPREYLEW